MPPKAEVDRSNPKAKPPTLVEVPPLVLRLAPVIKLTEDQFFKVCQINELLQIERTREGQTAPGLGSAPRRGSPCPMERCGPRTSPG